MKTIKHLQTAVLFLTAMLAAPLATANETPFRGTVEALETQVVTPPTLAATGAGGGNSTHLGKFTLTYTAQVNLVSGRGIGSFVFIAANGDHVYASDVGQSTPVIPGVVSIVETATITGGTGRFADATGNFVLTRILNRATGITSGSFAGTIVIPNGN